MSNQRPKRQRIVDPGPVDLPKATIRIPLREAMKLAELIEPPRPDPDLESLARHALGVRRRRSESWYRRAWWGWNVSRMIRMRLGRDRTREVEELFADQRLDSGGPRIWLGAHLGPAGVARYMIARSDPRVLFLGNALHQAAGEEIVEVRSVPQAALALARASAAIEGGRSVYCAFDGRYGNATHSETFLGRHVTFRSRLVESLLSPGVQPAIAIARWQGNAIELAAVDLPGESDVYRSYLHHLEELCRDDPANLRLSGGFWRVGFGGVFDG